MIHNRLSGVHRGIQWPELDVWSDNRSANKCHKPLDVHGNITDASFGGWFSKDETFRRRWSWHRHRRYCCRSHRPDARSFCVSVGVLHLVANLAVVVANSRHTECITVSSSTCDVASFFFDRLRI